MPLLRNLYLAAVDTVNHDGVEHAGYMSFMVLLSIFPFVIFFIIFANIFGASETGASFISAIFNELPHRAVDAMKVQMFELLSKPPQSLMTLAIIGSLWTASSFVEGLRTILNRVHRINAPPPYLLRRFLSIMQFLLIIMILYFVMMVLFVFPMILRKLPIIQRVIDELVAEHYVLVYMRYGIIVTTLFLACSTLYYMIPNIKLRFIDVVPGASLSVALWIITGSFLSKYIVYYRQLNIVYGSLGGTIVTLVFFYVVNLIFIYGAELNAKILSSKS